MILAEGTELADGRYTLVEHLGSGGMASVWLATDTTLQRSVAIKVMSDLLAGDERWLRRFRREARAAASLQHPNIVKVFDFGIEDGRPYLIMAYVAGGSLKDQLAAGASIEADAFARELLSALAHVHAAGILHRDVKPGNILLDEGGASHLTDFGIARPTDATDVTQTGMVLGTMRYLAPEVAAGEPASERSDLYSAGCVLDEVASEGAAPALRDLIDAMKADDPQARPASAEAALERLDAAPTAETGPTVALPDVDDKASTAATPSDAEDERPTATTRSDAEDKASTAAAESGAEETASTAAAKSDAGATGSTAAAMSEPDDTAATAVARPASRPAAPRPPGLEDVARQAGERWREARRSPWFVPVAALAAILVLAIVVVALASGGGGGGSAPTVAPSNAPLSQQLDQLDKAIDATR